MSWFISKAMKYCAGAVIKSTEETLAEGIELGPEINF